MRMRDKKRQYDKVKNQLDQVEDEFIPISKPTEPERPPIRNPVFIE